MKIAAGIAILLFSLSPPFTGAASVSTDTSEAGNTYISGPDLKIATPVIADLLAAGGRVSVERAVGADAALAGGTVDVRAPIGQDLRAAGGTVNVGASIGGQLVAAGGTVRVEDAAAIAGSAWLAGSDVTLAGTVGKGAKIAAGKFTLSSQINGNTRLYAQDIYFLPGARINGDLFYASPTPLTPEQAAMVQGAITREDIPARRDPGHGATRMRAWFLPFFVLSMLAAGALLYLLFPNAVTGTQRAIRQYPLRSLLAGLALLFTVPPVAILLMVTVIGLPIGFTLLALYPIMLLLGYLGAAFFVGRQVANVMKQPPQLSGGRQLMFLALALVILGVVAWVPFLGGLILMVVLVMGIGGWAVWIHARTRTGQVAPDAGAS
ncbi:MAG: hypothetical protein V4632_14580 [Pseudomonadota bacterium]